MEQDNLHIMLGRFELPDDTKIQKETDEYRVAHVRKMEDSLSDIIDDVEGAYPSEKYKTLERNSEPVIPPVSLSTALQVYDSILEERLQEHLGDDEAISGSNSLWYKDARRGFSVEEQDIHVAKDISNQSAVLRNHKNTAKLRSDHDVEMTSVGYILPQGAGLSLKLEPPETAEIPELPEEFNEETVEAYVNKVQQWTDRIVSFWQEREFVLKRDTTGPHRMFKDIDSYEEVQDNMRAVKSAEMLYA